MRMDKYMQMGMTFGEAAIARKADREKNKAAREALKARKIAEAKTCQCCGRQIFAETGTIAHHGYTRPDIGWQTASCMGAKYLPFEVSRDRLGLMIEALSDNIVRLRAQHAKVVDEKVSLRFNYERRIAVERWRNEYVKHWVEVTRDTFDDVKAAYENELRRECVRSFDDLKENALRSLKNDIDQNVAFRKEQKARYDAWKPTHKRQGKEWVAV